MLLFDFHIFPDTSFKPEPKFESTKDTADKNANSLQSGKNASLFDAFDDSFSAKASTLKTKKSSFPTDPFGDAKFGNANNNNNNNNEASTGFDDFNDNFGDLKITDNYKGPSSFKQMMRQQRNNNDNQLKSNKDFKSGYAKPMIKPRPNQDAPASISKSDFSAEDNFDAILATVLERSKIEQ